MLKRTTLTTLLISSLFIFLPSQASALTVDEIRSQINDLLRQISALEALLENAETTPTPTTSTNVTTHCPSLTRTLHRGDRDANTRGEVTELQKFLAGYFDLNPADIVTGYFGFLTERRVTQFQNEKGLPPVGIVGPRTRAAIAASCATKSQAVLPTDRPCSWNGITVLHGSSVNAYQASTVPAGEICTVQWRTCTNGVLSGSYQYPSCVTAPSVELSHPSCAFNGQTIAHGGSILAYQKSESDPGTLCTVETRLCSDGILSGSYTNASCTNTPAPTPAPMPDPAITAPTASTPTSPPSTSPSITVSSPASGSVLQRGSTITITWQSQNAPGDALVWIEFRQNPRFWDPTVITQSGPASGSMSVTVPAVGHATSYNQLCVGLGGGCGHFPSYAETTIPITIQ